ncbi:MAG: DUF1292 domain-containing protein [Clostridia bacterium]|nr:DUF1292 domain-containing protein [Clostridia bacterium]
MMNEELDLVTLVDEEGNEVVMEVLDYFFYEGKEYAVMTEYVEGGCDCDAESCEGCPEQKDAIIMKVQPVGDDEEEFVPIEDDELMDKLIDFVNNDLYAGDDAEYGEYDEEEDEE